jgi:NTP pyrophosphatase (non-canonical NTP hydrolase)
MTIYRNKPSRGNNHTPITRTERLEKLVEEMGEFLQAYGKAGRFGIDNTYNSGETNCEAMLRELRDVCSIAEDVEVDLMNHISKSSPMKLERRRG